MIEQGVGQRYRLLGSVFIMLSKCKASLDLRKADETAIGDKSTSY